MCTAVLSIEPGQPVLLAGVRDELTDRAWQPPGRHWAGYPELYGGVDLRAGGTWLAVHPAARRVACVLNGIGQPAPEVVRRSRGELPLRAAAGEPVDREGLAGLDPFWLLVAGPATANVTTWDGRELSERPLGPGLHMIVNSALTSLPPEELATSVSAREPRPAPVAVSLSMAPGSGMAPPDGREHERARLSRFLPAFAHARRPDPQPGPSAAEAWAGWFPLVNGDGLGQDVPGALIVRRDLGDGRVWGSTSVSLVALSRDGARYDFCGRPGDPGAWVPVL